MDTNKMREQFELAFLDECGVSTSIHAALLLERGADGGYLNPKTRIGWWSWQASRNAVVVELPRIEPAQTPSRLKNAAVNFALGCYKAACRQFIEAQGLKVAP